MEKNNRLLLVDDEERILESLRRLLKKEGYEIFTATSGREGLDILQRETVGVVVSDMMMPEMDGVEFLAQASTLSSDTVQVLLTGHAKLETALDAINRLGVFSFIVKPWNNYVLVNDLRRAFDTYNLVAENRHLFQLTEQKNHELKEANESLEERVKHRTQLLQEAIEESILMLARAAEAKDDDAEGHIHRVYSMVFDLCKELGVPDDKTGQIALFSMVHDIGKLKISDDILRKKDLSEAEAVIRKSHVTAGEEMLGVKPFYKIAREIARSHHENWDGTGYPDGLKETEIPLAARIVALVDTVDALTHKEPYKNAWDKKRVLQEIKKLAGTRFDPRIVEAFVSLQQKRSGRKAQVKDSA